MQQQSQENKEETTRTFNFLVLYIRHTSYIVHRTRTTVIIIIFFFEMNYLLFSIFFFHLGCIVVIGYEYTVHMNSMNIHNIPHMNDIIILKSDNNNV